MYPRSASRSGLLRLLCRSFGALGRFFDTPGGGLYPARGVIRTHRGRFGCFLGSNGREPALGNLEADAAASEPDLEA